MKKQTGLTGLTGFGSRKNRANPVQAASHSGLRVLRIIAITYALVVGMLGLSLYWNIQQAIDSTARGQALYKAGLIDGEAFTRDQLLRAQIERELIDEQQAQLNREKL